MRARTYKTEAIVLKRINFGEADKILTLFSKHCGKISAIAKGVRKLTSRKAASLELFNNVVLFLAKGKNLDIITETSLVSSFPKFRKDFSKVKIAFEACEVVERLTVEKNANDLVFLKLKNFLYGLNCHPGGNVAADRISFEHKGDSIARRIPGSRMTMLDFKKDLLNLLGFGLPKTLTNESLDNYIESIIEKKLMVRRIL